MAAISLREFIEALEEADQAASDLHDAKLREESLQRQVQTMRTELELAVKEIDRLKILGSVQGGEMQKEEIGNLRNELEEALLSNTRLTGEVGKAKNDVLHWKKQADAHASMCDRLNADLSRSRQAAFDFEQSNKKMRLKLRKIEAVMLPTDD